MGFQATRKLSFGQKRRGLFPAMCARTVLQDQHQDQDRRLRGRHHKPPRPEDSISDCSKFGPVVGFSSHAETVFPAKRKRTVAGVTWSRRPRRVRRWCWWSSRACWSRVAAGGGAWHRCRYCSRASHASRSGDAARACGCADEARRWGRRCPGSPGSACCWCPLPPSADTQNKHRLSMSMSVSIRKF